MEVIEDCKNTSHYLPAKVPDFKFWLYQNSSRDVKDYVKGQFKDSDFIWRPRNCLFSQCKWYSVGDTKPFLDVSRAENQADKAGTILYDYALSTAQLVPVDTYKFGCQVAEDANITIYGQPFKAEVAVDCEDI